MLFDLLLGRARSPNSMFDLDHTRRPGPPVLVVERIPKRALSLGDAFSIARALCRNTRAIGSWSSAPTPSFAERRGASSAPSRGIEPDGNYHLGGLATSPDPSHSEMMATAVASVDERFSQTLPLANRGTPAVAYNRQRMDRNPVGEPSEERHGEKGRAGRRAGAALAAVGALLMALALVDGWPLA